MNKLLGTSLVLMTAGVIGILFAVIMEIITQEPVYMLVMKITAGMFGVGGPIFGWAVVKKRKR